MSTDEPPGNSDTRGVATTDPEVAVVAQDAESWRQQALRLGSEVERVRGAVALLTEHVPSQQTIGMNHLYCGCGLLWPCETWKEAKADVLR